MDFDTIFPDEREKGETLTRQCQLVMLRMFKILDYLCRRHGVEYFLTGGTLIGAVRHKGFIPWDDDLDVGMTRANYEKFVQFAVPELPKDIFFQNDETDPRYPSGHFMEARLRDKYSRYSTEDKKFHNGLQIDISIYDRAYLPHNFFIWALNRLFIRYYKQKDRKRAVILKRIQKFSPFPLVYSTSFIRRREMIKLGSNFIRAKEIASLLIAKFEDVETFIPVGYDGYLKRRYGNYMELPPEHKQRGHHSDSNHMQGDYSRMPQRKINYIAIPNPFTPCEHKEILQWKDKKQFSPDSTR